MELSIELYYEISRTGKKHTFLSYNNNDQHIKQFFCAVGERKTSGIGKKGKYQSGFEYAYPLDITYDYWFNELIINPNYWIMYDYSGNKHKVNVCNRVEIINNALKYFYLNITDEDVYSVISFIRLLLYDTIGINIDDFSSLNNNIFTNMHAHKNHSNMSIITYFNNSRLACFLKNENKLCNRLDNGILDINVDITIKR